MQIDRRTQQFNKLFQRFERLVKEKTQSNDGTKFLQAVQKLETKNSFIKENYHLIEDLYALRNVFSHRERGRLIASISDEALVSLQYLLEQLKKPRTVASVFMQKDGVYQARTDDMVSRVMRHMDEHVYTHVPVWQEERLIGVFAYSSLFAWLTDAQKKSRDTVVFEKQYMSDISPRFLNSPAVNFKFVSEKLSAFEIHPIFQDAVTKRKRLDVLLITKNGKRDEKISGLITPWDLNKIS